MAAGQDWRQCITGRVPLWRGCSASETGMRQPTDSGPTSLELRINSRPFPRSFGLGWTDRRRKRVGLDDGRSSRWGERAEGGSEGERALVRRIE
jgi:hypothetical protein